MNHTEAEPPFKNIRHLQIDTIYQNEFLQVLRDLTSPLWIGFYDGRSLAEILDSSRGDSGEFIKMQQKYIYGLSGTLDHKRKSIYDASELRSFLDKCNVEISKVETDNQKITWFLIRPSEKGVSIPSEVGQSKTDLPSSTDSFYKGQVNIDHEKAKAQASRLPIPRVLNIGSGGDENRQIPHAINIDLSDVGQPQVIADARYLPFADHSMTMIMASHVLEHMTLPEAKDAIREWLRVLHPKGSLRIAVPDAAITLQELRTGVTQKGEKSYSIPGGSAPLTQIQGLGGENSLTHPRWRHQVLYDSHLLEQFVQEVSSERPLVRRDYARDEALSILSGIKLDETNRYSLKAQFDTPKEQQRSYPEATYAEYLDRKKQFLKEYQFDKQISIVIPVRNEAQNLSAFFLSLLEVASELQTNNIDYEIIFALNGSEDSSEEIVRSFCAKHRDIPFTVALSNPGILEAFVKGLESRRMNGYIAKLDVDATSNSWNLPLMYMDLVEHKNKFVAYAEVIPLESNPTPFNAGEFYQQFRTERLYFHGRMSMYKENPFTRFPKELVLGSKAQVEDMILSSLYIYYVGLDSIGVTDGAVVRSSSISSFENLQKNGVRARAEIKRICEAFPQFEILRNILRREPIAPPTELRDSDPELYSLWVYYYHLNMAFQELIKLEKLSPDNKLPDEWSRVRRT